MYPTKVISFRAEQSAVEAIDRIMQSGLAATATEAINRALAVAPRALLEELELQAAELERRRRALRGGESEGLGTGAVAEATTPWPYTTKVESVQSLIETFREALGLKKLRPFGSESLGLGGASDGNDGVQWNAWVEYAGSSAWLGVNLEGLKYENWPIATYILRELNKPELLALAGGLEHASDVRMSWWRDAWQGAGRLVRFREHVIADGIVLDALTPASYEKMLREALGCLDESRDHRGRATQKITLRSGPTVRPVSPHFQFRTALWSGVPEETERRKRIAAAERLLGPLYDFVRRRTA